MATTATYRQVTCPQTISFIMRIRFDHIERDGAREIELAFDSFDKMVQRYHKERKRRRRGDRATSATYRQVLTQYGRDMLASDDNHYNAERYSDAINGTWFTW